MYEMSCQSRFDARYWMLGAGALGRPRGMVRGGRREEGSGWGTRVYLWWIHVDIWQNQYDVVKLKNKRNKNKKIKNLSVKPSCPGLFLGGGYFFIYLFIFYAKSNFVLFLNFIVLVLPNIDMNLPQVYMCSPS